MKILQVLLVMLFVILDNRLALGYRVEFACVVFPAEELGKVSIQLFALPAVFGRQPILINYAMYLFPCPSQFGSGYSAEWSAVYVCADIVATLRTLVELSAIQVFSVWVYMVAEHLYGLQLFVATYAINLHTLRLPPNSIQQILREVSRHLLLYRFDKFCYLSGALYYKFVALKIDTLHLKQ